jgi:epoxyqueuosine reductase QueG
MANEAIARTYSVVSIGPPYDPKLFTGNNLTLQSRLYELRSETKDAFDEAKDLEARWKELEKEQKEVYQVLLTPFAHPQFSRLNATVAFHPTVPHDALEA